MTICLRLDTVPALEGQTEGQTSSSSSLPFIYQVDIRNLNYSELQ